MILDEFAAAIGRCRDFGVPGTVTTNPRVRCRLMSSWPTRESAKTSSNDSQRGFHAQRPRLVSAYRRSSRNVDPRFPARIESIALLVSGKDGEMMDDEMMVPD